jgi:hypothetical protein
MHCEIVCHSASPHIQQLFTGLSLLKKKGVVDYVQTISKVTSIKTKYQIDRLKRESVILTLNSAFRIFYDVHDSDVINESALRNTDLYFKRSYDAAVVQACSKPHKVYPYGLNYEVSPNEPDVHGAWRSLIYLKGFERIRRALLTLHLHPSSYQLNALEAPPQYGQEPRILFMAAAWDPKEKGRLDKDKREFREWLNQSRAKCIELLRREFGERFYGGFIHSEFSKRKYARCLVPQAGSTSKRKYLQMVREHPICIATTGLHGSIGWKFAEYVALSRAIVSEPLRHVLPGEFGSGRNYLAFASPQECVPLVAELVSNKSLRNELMTNNASYYHSNLRPDRLVLNTLLIASRAAVVNRAGAEGAPCLPLHQASGLS